MGSAGAYDPARKADTDAALAVATLPDGSSVVAGVFNGVATFGEGQPAETTRDPESPGGGAGSPALQGVLRAPQAGQRMREVW